MTQLQLFTTPVAPTNRAATFDDFHAANPHVYRELRRLALHYVDQGRARVSMKFLFEILRHRFIATDGGEFVLNNNYTAKYARLLKASEPRLATVFETRKAKS